tara:strand:+ start:88 stop:624 length:537 start_codon:yes stop_codon:yes gene_type:complete
LIEKEIGNFLKYVRLLPITLFLILSYFLYWKINNVENTKELQSVLLNQELPKLNLEHLEGKLLKEVLGKEPFILNFFASWCAPCREEHAVLEKFSKDNIIIGVAYKDNIKDIKRFLNILGNPYDTLLIDEKGRAAIDIGLYGVPETYFINRAGQIKYRQVGPLTVLKFENIMNLINTN